MAPESTGMTGFHRNGTGFCQNGTGMAPEFIIRNSQAVPNSLNSLYLALKKYLLLFILFYIQF
jgi:hypothetical protein